MIYHLAIPVADLATGIFFYKLLGCPVGRTYQQSCIIDFFGMQLVLHKSKVYAIRAEMYPRHFGIIVKEEEFKKLYSKVMTNDFLRQHIFEKMFLRYQGERSEHSTFFLRDPSNNVIEFKWYRDEEAILGSPHKP